MNDVKNKWRLDIESALFDFKKIMNIASEKFMDLDFSTEFLAAPHRPSGLPKGKMAVYCFWGDNCWLKIGKVGENSDARFRSQHYLPKSSNSNLAKSILNDTNFVNRNSIQQLTCKEWMQENLNRCNILIDAKHPKTLLSFLETFLHVRLNPRYEG